MTRAGAVVAIVIAGSCLVDRRSPDFRCDTAADCTDGRACSPTGFCIDAGGDGVIDCDDDLRECTASCSSDAPCGVLTCPEGYDCRFDCEAPNSCSSINCVDAAFCDVDCNAPNACGAIACGSNGAGACDIECNANNACPAIDCSQACACDIFCDGGSSCRQNTCPDSAQESCSDGDGGCDSNNRGCDSC